MASVQQFRHEDVSAVPRGYRVRTISHPSGHKVRVAYPPGPRRKGSGKLVSILHPRSESNPCGFDWKSAVGSRRSAAGNPKSKTREQVEKMQEKAVKFLRDVVKDSDKADEIEGLSVGDYAEKKGITIGNPKSGSRQSAVGSRQNDAFSSGYSWKMHHPGEPSFHGWETSGKAKGFDASDWIRGAESADRSMREGKLKPIGRHKRRKNQQQTEAAAALYEIFHGKKPKEIIELHQDVIRREDYAALGQLIEISLPDIGVAVEFTESDKVLLAASPNGKQLYAIGGNQDLRAVLGKLADDEKDFLDLGEVGYVVYRTRKDFDKFEEIDYKHRMGEGGHEKPRLMYDKMNKQIYFVGGEYDASRHEGIVH